MRKRVVAELLTRLTKHKAEAYVNRKLGHGRQAQLQEDIIERLTEYLGRSADELEKQRLKVLIDSYANSRNKEYKELTVETITKMTQGDE